MGNEVTETGKGLTVESEPRGTRVLRLTRHTASEEQTAELHGIFGPATRVIEVSQRVQNAEEVRQLVEEHGATVLEAVLPTPLLQDVLDEREGVGIPVIRAQMQRKLEGNTATFEFEGYEEVVAVNIVTKPLERKYEEWTDPDEEVEPEPEV